MRGLNKVQLIGNLGNIPDFQVLEGNISVAKFSLATTESYKDKNGTTQSSTDWHNKAKLEPVVLMIKMVIKNNTSIQFE